MNLTMDNVFERLECLRAAGKIPDQTPGQSQRNDQSSSLVEEITQKAVQEASTLFPRERVETPTREAGRTDARVCHIRDTRKKVSNRKSREKRSYRDKRERQLLIESIERVQRDFEHTKTLLNFAMDLLNTILAFSRSCSVNDRAREGLMDVRG
uniref:BZIP domain-containing protein n=1 Tax=Compsopogon caeruleus TaxID=31354 RepID=A0A7S1T8K1_9RHOD|mmetsp:Transcript_12628/g.25614  ORF Transcript_12628/g.25614 Transcript_12628/m.25614 type:complete len:154 (+) Transcript_12628:408-869(+)